MNQTVLLIDDSKFQRRANELAITKSGYAVVVAHDGDQGLGIAREKIPDVIVLDMMLPGLSGPELLRILKQDPLTSSIPVIVLSSLPRTNEAKLKAEGAALYLEKSSLGIETGCAVLIRAIESVLPERQGQTR